MPDFKTHEQTVEEILSRYSVTDLREQTEADLVIGDTLFYKAKTPIKIIEQGETNFIRWWKIASGESTYEVRRFKNFVWCSCKGFFFTKRICKHLAFTTGVYCERCHELPARQGKYCWDCHGVVTRFQPARATV